MKHILEKDLILWRIYVMYSEITPEFREPRNIWTDVNDIWHNGMWRRANNNKSLDFLHSYYYYMAKVWNLYQGSFDDFKLHMERGVKNPYRKESKYYGRYRWECLEITRYQKQDHHKKKVLTFHQEQCILWRKKKKHKTHRGRYWDRGINKKSWCKEANRKERQILRELIHNADWGNYTHPKKRETLNPWDWS